MISNIQIYEDGTITCPVGGTGYISITIQPPCDESFDTETDVCLFVMREKSRRCCSKEILYKESSLVSVGNNYEVKWVFSNEETRNLRAGNYIWDAILVTNPDRDEQGKVIVNEENSSVYHCFATKGTLPKFIVLEAITVV